MFKTILLVASLVGLIILAVFGKTLKKRLKKTSEESKVVKFEWNWKYGISVLFSVALVVYLATISFWFAVCFAVCLAAAALAIFRLVMTVPTNNVAIKTLFGKRRKGFVKEGLRFRLPFETMPLYPIVPIPISDIKTEATSRDDLKLALHLSFEFCYDPSITENGICVFSGYDNNDAIIKGITDELKVIAKSIVGVSTAQQINIAQKEINLLLSVMARLPSKSVKQIHPEEAVAYYKSNFANIEKKLSEEHLKINDHSRLEEKYGVDITRVDLAIEYSDEARKILEKNKVAEEESLVSKKIIETVENLKKSGLSPDKAASSALLIYKKDNSKLWIKDINIAGINQLPEIIEKAVKLVFEKEKNNG